MHLSGSVCVQTCSCLFVFLTAFLSFLVHSDNSGYPRIPIFISEGIIDDMHSLLRGYGVFLGFVKGCATVFFVCLAITVQADYPVFFLFIPNNTLPET